VDRSEKQDLNIGFGVPFAVFPTLLSTFLPGNFSRVKTAIDALNISFGGDEGEGDIAPAALIRVTFQKVMGALEGLFVSERRTQIRPDSFAIGNVFGLIRSIF